MKDSCYCADKESQSEEVKAELDVQLIGINRMMSCDQDYVAADAYEVLCKVRVHIHRLVVWDIWWKEF